MQGVEAAAAVEAHPVADGLGGDAGAVGAGREVDEVGEEAVAEQRHGLPSVVVGCLRQRRVSLAAVAVGCGER